jgi:hypothetical protein
MNIEVKKWLDYAITAKSQDRDTDAFLALRDAVMILNEQAVPDPRVFRHDWTPDEIKRWQAAHPKPLTLSMLSDQVSDFIRSSDDPILGPGCADVFIIGDFEIRSRK